MQITIGKRIDCNVGAMLYYQDSIGNKAHFVVTSVDGCIIEMRSATRWEIFKFKVLMPWRRLKRAIRNRR